MTRQRIPPPSSALVEVSPADAYYTTVWARRVATAAEPREPADVERARAASHEQMAATSSSWHVVHHSDVVDGVAPGQLILGEDLSAYDAETPVVVEGHLVPEYAARHHHRA